MKELKIKIHIISEELFHYSLLIYLALLILEIFKEGFVSYFLNTLLLLGIVIVLGVLTFFTHEEYSETKEDKKGKLSEDIQNSVVYATIGGGLVYLKTLELGMIAFVLAAIATAIIFLLCLLLLMENE